MSIPEEIFAQLIRHFRFTFEVKFKPINNSLRFKKIKELRFGIVSSHLIIEKVSWVRVKVRVRKKIYCDDEKFTQISKIYIKSIALSIVHFKVVVNQRSFIKIQLPGQQKFRVHSLVAKTKIRNCAVVAFAQI